MTKKTEIQEIKEQIIDVLEDKMSREEKIDKLVKQDIEDIKTSILNYEYLEFLTNVLRGNGWKGYDFLTNKELDIALKERFEEEE